MAVYYFRIKMAVYYFPSILPYSGKLGRLTLGKFCCYFYNKHINKFILLNFKKIHHQCNQPYHLVKEEKLYDHINQSRKHILQNSASILDKISQEEKYRNIVENNFIIWMKNRLQLTLSLKFKN